MKRAAIGLFRRLSIFLIIACCFVQLQAAAARPHRGDDGTPRIWQASDSTQDSAQSMESANNDQSANDEQSNEAGSEESSAQTSGSERTPMRGLGAFARAGYTQPGVSLFSVVGNMMLFWFGIVFGLGLLMAANVLACAIVWHVTKALRGGKNPAVG